MKKHVGLFGIMCILLALSFTMVSCGGGGGGEVTYEKDGFTLYWFLDPENGVNDEYINCGEDDEYEEGKKYQLNSDAWDLITTAKEGSYLLLEMDRMASNGGFGEIQIYKEGGTKIGGKISLEGPATKLEFTIKKLQDGIEASVESGDNQQPCPDWSQLGGDENLLIQSWDWGTPAALFKAIAFYSADEAIVDPYDYEFDITVGDDEVTVELETGKALDGKLYFEVVPAWNFNETGTVEFRIDLLFEDAVDASKLSGINVQFKMKDGTGLAFKGNPNISFFDADNKDARMGSDWIETNAAGMLALTVAANTIAYGQLANFTLLKDNEFDHIRIGMTDWQTGGSTWTDAQKSAYTDEFYIESIELTFAP